MITILNGKLTIPESERFIGFAGDNLARTIEFLISGLKDADRIYRLYLTFDDGTVNHFVLPAKVTGEGVLLTWNVKREHIFKSGNVRVQIKAFSQTGIVYHTRPDTLIVGNSAEFSDTFNVHNSEFLEYEEMLNNLKAEVSDICVMTPYIGENGNWYVYDAERGEYTDSGRPSCADGADITVDQTFDALSENPQSGKAVAEALADITVGDTEEIIVEQSYNPASSNAQSGKAVAQAISQVNTSESGNCWQRKKFSAATYVKLDEMINTGSSDYDIFVVTLGPDLIVDDMSDEPFIAYIDGEHNGNVLMMDMGTGEWWQYKYKSNNINKVNNPHFVFIGHFMSRSFVANYPFNRYKLYLFEYEGDNEIPAGTYLGRYDTANGETYLEFTSSVPDGKVYTLNFADLAVEIDGVQDFIYAGKFNTQSHFKNYGYELNKIYLFCLGGGLAQNIGISGGYYTGMLSDTAYAQGERVLLFTSFVPDGKHYSMDLGAYELTASSVFQTEDTAIKDEGEYFVSGTVEGALQELGAALYGVTDLLSDI